MEDSFKAKLQKDALETTVKSIQQRIEKLTCPEHQGHPQLKFSEDSGAGEQKMSFDCCCDVLAKMLQEALKT